MQPPATSLHSYNRAAAAVILWCVAPIFPVPTASGRSPTTEPLPDLGFCLAFTGYGVMQLVVALKKRLWSDMLIAASVILVV